MGWIIGIAVVVLICAAIGDAANKKKLLKALEANLRSAQTSRSPNTLSAVTSRPGLRWTNRAANCA